MLTVNTHYNISLYRTQLTHNPLRAYAIHIFCFNISPTKLPVISSNRLCFILFNIFRMSTTHSDQHAPDL